MKQEYSPSPKALFITEIVVIIAAIIFVYLCTNITQTIYFIAGILAGSGLIMAKGLTKKEKQ